MRVRRRLCRALLVVAAALPGAVVALPAARAAAADTDPLAVRIVDACPWLIAGERTAFRIAAVNNGATPYDSVSLVPHVPAGFTAMVAGQPAPLLPGATRYFTVLVEPVGGRPTTNAALRFDVVAPGLTRSVETAPPVVGRPEAPTGVVATAGDGVATVTWRNGPARTWPGDDTPRVYVVRAHPGGQQATVVDAETATVAGLANDIPQAFTVTEHNGFGTATSAPSAQIVAMGVPDVVERVEVTGSGTTRQVSWPRPDHRGSPISGYTVAARAPGTNAVVATVQVAAPATSAVVTGLDETVDGYQFTVRATNAVGTGPESHYWGGPPPVFRGPITLHDYDGELFAEADTWSSGDGVLLTVEPGGRSVAEWSGYFAGFPPGTTVAVTAQHVNEHGPGPRSRPQSLTLRREQPDRPVAGAYVPGPDGTAHVCYRGSWGRGSPVTEYVVTAPYDEHGTRTWTFPANRRAGTITDLRDRMVYPFDLAAATPTSRPLETDWWALPSYRAYAPAAAPSVHAAQGRLGAAYVEFGFRDHVDGAVEVVASPGGARRFAPIADGGVEVTGLDPGVTYTFTVRTVNEAGYGAPGTTAPVLVAAAPGAVPGVTVAVLPDDPNAVRVAWSPAPPNSAAVTSYDVTWGDDHHVVQPPATSLVVRGLTPGRTYSYGVAAVNDFGPGPYETRTWKMPPYDTTPPTVRVTAPRPVALDGTARVSYVATDAVTGIASYDVRYRAARYDRGFGPYRYPASWQRTAATTRGVTPLPGTTYCFGVRARDGEGNVSAWTADACTSTPVDDAELFATAGWARRAHPETFGGTYTVSGRAGAALTLPDVRARRLSLVAIRCAVCGDVGVYLDGVLVRRLSLRASATAYRQALTADLGSVRTGTVTLRVLSGRVHVDALAVRPV